MYKSKYFKDDEIKCHCCGFNAMSENALYMFDRIREAYGKPMIVNSGCRCGSHNAKVGGSVNSAHVPAEDGLCYAMDIKIKNSNEAYLLIKIALSYGCQRWGLGKGFVHIDFSPFLPQEKAWSY